MAKGFRMLRVFRGTVGAKSLRVAEVTDELSLYWDGKSWSEPLYSDAEIREEILGLSGYAMNALRKS